MQVISQFKDARPGAAAGPSKARVAAVAIAASHKDSLRSVCGLGWCMLTLMLLGVSVCGGNDTLTIRSVSRNAGKACTRTKGKEIQARGRAPSGRTGHLMSEMVQPG